MPSVWQLWEPAWESHGDYWEFVQVKAAPTPTWMPYDQNDPEPKHVQTHSGSHMALLTNDSNLFEYYRELALFSDSYDWPRLIPIKPDRAYRVRVWAQTSPDIALQMDRCVEIYAETLNEDVKEARTRGDTWGLASGTWQRMEITLPGSPGVDYMNVFLRLRGNPNLPPGAYSWVYFDDVTVEELPAAPYVSNPVAPRTVSRADRFAVYGYLRPRHAAGTYPVRIYKYRYVSGAWKGYGYVQAKASNYSSYTKYAASLRLPYAGRWRLRAYAPEDAVHAPAWSSGYDYVTVK